MGLRLNERYAVIKETAKRYHKSRKKEKGRILDGFLKLIKYNRKYAIHVPLNWGKKKEILVYGKRVVAIAGKGGRKRYHRAPVYGEGVKAALIKIWSIYGCICGKRLRAVFEG